MYTVCAGIVIVLDLLTITLGMVSTLVFIIFTSVLCLMFIYIYVYLIRVAIPLLFLHLILQTSVISATNVFAGLLYEPGSSVSVVLLYFIVMSLIIP